MPTKKTSARSAKTQPTSASVSVFLAAAAPGPRLADAKALVAMMEKATGTPAQMWGNAIVGCGMYTIRYADGREAPWPLVAFSPRKAAFVLYLGWKKHADLVKKAGKIKAAGGCLHLKTLADADPNALQQLITAAAKSRQTASAT